MPPSESSAPPSCQEGSGPLGSLGEASALITGRGPDKRQRWAIRAPRRCHPSRTPRAGLGTQGRRAQGELGRPEGAVLVAHGCQTPGNVRAPALGTDASGRRAPRLCRCGGDGHLEGTGGPRRWHCCVCCTLGPVYSRAIDKGGVITRWHLCPASEASHPCVTNPSLCPCHRHAACGHRAARQEKHPATRLAQPTGTFIARGCPQGTARGHPIRQGGREAAAVVPGTAPGGQEGLRRTSRHGAWRAGGCT